MKKTELLISREDGLKVFYGYLDGYREKQLYVVSPQKPIPFVIRTSDYLIIQEELWNEVIEEVRRLEGDFLVFIDDNIEMIGRPPKGNIRPLYGLAIRLQGGLQR